MRPTTHVAALALAALGCGVGCVGEATPAPGPDGAGVDGGGPRDGRFTAEGWTPALDARLPDAAEEVLRHQLVVLGAGTGGAAAAIQAARLGLDVALVEETDWVGGQAFAAGVSTMDVGPFATDTGIYAELIARVDAHYAARGKRSRRCGIRAVPCMEPAVGQRVLRQLLAEAHVRLYERARLLAARVAGGARPTLAAVKLHQKGAAERLLVLEAQLFIDATEYGDLLPLTPARYRAGAATSDALDEGDCVQDVTYAPIIKRYDALPAALRIAAPPPGYGPEVEQKFAAIVAAGGKDWQTGGWGAGYPVNWRTHVAYRATPDSSRAGDSSEGDFDTITRTGVNWANDWPYTVADLQRDRFAANCAAKLHTIQFLYYAQQIVGAAQWSVADDEGYDTPYNVEDNDCPEIPAALDAIERQMPPLPYVRESRRVIGLHTLRAAEIQRPGGSAPAPRRFPSAVAVGDYAMDLHRCDGAGDFESGLESKAEMPAEWRAGAFQIPYEVFVPQDVDGLLVAEKNLSQTRLVSGATRLQPSTMHTGQAAGVIAALAVQRGEAPRALAPIRAQAVLVDAGARIGTVKFSDVPLGHAAWADVELASGRAILVGHADGRFGLGEALTRAQLAIFLVRLLGLDAGNPPASPRFADVPSGHFAYAEVEALAAAGLTAGCGDGSRFCPDESATRAQLATFLARGLGFPGAGSAQPRYEDVAAGSPHFGAIQWLSDEQLLRGCSATPPRFCPDAPATRQQAATLVRRVLLWLADRGP